MQSRLCHLLYNHVIYIIGVSRGVRFVKGGEICQGGELLSKGVRFCQRGWDFVKGGVAPLNEALSGR